MVRASRSKRARNWARRVRSGGQDLDGDRAVEARVAGLVDLAHAAGPDEVRRPRTVRADLRAPGSCPSRPPYSGGSCAIRTLPVMSAALKTRRRRPTAIENEPRGAHARVAVGVEDGDGLAARRLRGGVERLGPDAEEAVPPGQVVQPAAVRRPARAAEPVVGARDLDRRRGSPRPAALDRQGAVRVPREHGQPPVVPGEIRVEQRRPAASKTGCSAPPATSRSTSRFGPVRSRTRFSSG